MPSRTLPQLAEPSIAPPSGDDWIHEIKFDGYRTMARIADGAATMITRAGLDWTKRYGDLSTAFVALPCQNAMIDGEIVVLDDKGVSRFSALQRALADEAVGDLVFYAFDLLHLDGHALVDVPLEQRKSLLAKILDGRAPNSAIQFSDHAKGDGLALYERASEMGLEGIVSKRASSPYRSGRSPNWIKTKALKAGDFAIVGYSTSEAAGGLAALALADGVDGEHIYCGKVGTGFDATMLRRLERELEPLQHGAVRVEGLPKTMVATRPVLTAQIHYAGRTNNNSLRHAVFKRLHEVKASRRRQAPSKRLISDADMAAIWVSNPTRRMFGKAGATKLDIALYYARIGEAMLPHLLERPVSLVRCPSGRAQDCFFQRHAFVGMPDELSTFEMRNSEDELKSYLAIVDAKGYLALAQFGVVEFHLWGSIRSHPETADRVVFDLDPGEGVAWRDVVEAAVHVRGELNRLGLVTFVKTTGGKGLHLVVPITPRLGWKQVHAATGAIAARIAKGAPGVFVTMMGKDNRKQRIFIDFHRNARGATAVAPYSLRGRANLPVSTPLTWSDVESIDGPADLNYSSVPGLVRASGAPWAAIDLHARDLPVLK